MKNYFETIINFFITIILILWAVASMLRMRIKGKFKQNVFCDHEWAYKIDAHTKQRKCTKCKKQQFYDFYYDKWNNI